MSQAIKKSRGWMLDVDGCLVRTSRAGGAGGTPMPLAAEFLTALYAAGHNVIVCTNASEKTPQEYAAHLRGIGLPVRDADFMTAGSAAADYIAHHHPGARVLVLGAEGIAAPLRELGVTLADPHGPAEVVVVGADSSYGTPMLNAAALAVDAGAPLYTTVSSPWFHGGAGKSICVSAAMAHAITWVTGIEPKVLGKPSPELGETLIRRLGHPPESITIVGDAPAEIQLARHMGANAALVLSGAITEAGLAALPESDRPDLAVADIAVLHDMLFPALSLTQGK